MRYALIVGWCLRQCAHCSTLSTPALLFAAFCAGVGLPELAEHAYATGARGAEVADQLAAAIAAHPLDHWLTVFDGQDVCVDAVATPEEAMSQPGAPTFTAGSSAGVHLHLGAPLPQGLEAVAVPVPAHTVLDDWS